MNYDSRSDGSHSLQPCCTQAIQPIKGTQRLPQDTRVLVRVYPNVGGRQETSGSESRG